MKTLCKTISNIAFITLVGASGISHANSDQGDFVILAANDPGAYAEEYTSDAFQAVPVTYSRKYKRSGYSYGRQSYNRYSYKPRGYYRNRGYRSDYYYGKRSYHRKQYRGHNRYYGRSRYYGHNRDYGYNRYRSHGRGY